MANGFRGNKVASEFGRRVSHTGQSLACYYGLKYIAQPSTKTFLLAFGRQHASLCVLRLPMRLAGALSENAIVDMVKVLQMGKKSEIVACTVAAQHRAGYHIERYAPAEVLVTTDHGWSFQ